MPTLHFSRPEFDRRLAAARASLEREGLDGLVLFRQDSMYWLTGYDASLAACGYTMGAMYPPTWMDWPMVWAGNPQVLEPGMVFFLHMILLDDSTGLSMCVGETAIVTDGECERVNHIPREPIVN